MVVPGGATAFMTNSEDPKGGEVVATSRFISVTTPNHTGSKPTASTMGIKSGIATIIMAGLGINMPRISTTTCIEMSTQIGETGMPAANLINPELAPLKARI